MSKKSEVRTRAFLKIIAKLQAYIRENDYTDGGWLPSGRKMAVMLGCSHLTYCKALKFIEQEAIAISFPSKGHYIIPEFLRTKKVGLIVGSGDTLGYFPHEYRRSAEGFHCILSATVDTLTEQRYDIQFLQMPRPEQSLGLADVYFMKGVIWINPPTKHLDLIHDFRKNHPHLPLALVSLQYNSIFLGLDGSFVPEVFDPLRKRVEFIMDRGHKRVLFMGDYSLIKDSESEPIFEKYDCRFNIEDCHVGNFLQYSEIADLVKERGYTAIIANGGANRMNFLFQALRVLPDAQKPEVLIYDQGLYDNIRTTAPSVFSEYPTEKVLYVPEAPPLSIGVSAANYLLVQMQKVKASKKFNSEP